MFRTAPSLMPPSDPRWTYDDPSGVPDEVPITVHVPEPMLAGIQRQAAHDGLTPAAWLLDTIQRSLRPTRPTAA
ncbi:MAG TPA: hypothetical protein VGF23_24320 [Gaiellaceae bacterium]|jgi:hypothetical protein